MHRVKWKLKKHFLLAKGKLSIARSEKFRDKKVPFGFSKFNFELRESRGKIMHKIYSNYVSKW